MAFCMTNMLTKKRKILLIEEQSVLEATKQSLKEPKTQCSIVEPFKTCVQKPQIEERIVLEIEKRQGEKIREELDKKVIRFNWSQFPKDAFCHTLTFFEFEELRGGLARVNKRFKKMCYSQESYRHVRLDMRFMKYVMFTPKISATTKKERPKQQITTVTRVETTMCDRCHGLVPSWKWFYIGSMQEPEKEKLYFFIRIKKHLHT
ncbi:hypothetical protein RFI_32242 [Reticulomyxa filosa]|uniref:F-box domain-containing protein n=1 Tax=Reticulomyxa filosa TaxID=46433 RepID=X6LU25_RETFI|nr:hypothetical protein RFI_32242 [Reticulomyxa filosa]|eukprot:ETO05154.1 hypothetical protein RFI_32242 [Reticulomyxa filosa]